MIMDWSVVSDKRKNALRFNLIKNQSKLTTVERLKGQSSSIKGSSLVVGTVLSDIKLRNHIEISSNGGNYSNLLKVR
jgi:hypothetical protein